MRLVKSKQVGVAFIKCPDPVTIDKSKSWGADPSNFQKALNGAFLKMKNASTVSHLVQPNADFSAPVGWEWSGEGNLYDKLPIFVGELVPAGEPKALKTLDGEIAYLSDEDSYVVCNRKDNAPDLDDCWCIKKSQLIKDYEF